MKDSKEWVVVGRFGRPHGVKGYISIYSFTDPRENILLYPDWFVQLKGHWTSVTRQKVEEHHRYVVAMIDGYDNREQVGLLTNHDIAVQSCQFPRLESGEYYWHQLIGMTVLNKEGERLGTVSEIIPTGSNDVLVVTGQGRFLIPYRYGSTVLEVSEERHQIRVDWDNDYL